MYSEVQPHNEELDSYINTQIDRATVTINVNGFDIAEIDPDNFTQKDMQQLMADWFTSEYYERLLDSEHLTEMFMRGYHG